MRLSGKTAVVTDGSSPHDYGSKGITFSQASAAFDARPQLPVLMRSPPEHTGRHKSLGDYLKANCFIVAWREYS